MASPLSMKASTAMNTVTPAISICQSTHALVDYKCSAGGDDSENLQISPFATIVRDSQEPGYVSSIKPSTSSVERNVTSPTKMQKSPVKGTTKSFQGGNLGERGSSKLSTGNGHYTGVTCPTEDCAEESLMSLGITTRDTEELKRAMLNDENEEYVPECRDAFTGTDATVVNAGEDTESEGLADETAFSNFSAIPDMTTFAKTGHSPTRFTDVEETKKGCAQKIAYTASSPSSPHRHQAICDMADGYNDVNTTNLILDFTEQFNNLFGSTYGRQSPRREIVSPANDQTARDFLAHARCDGAPSPMKHRQQLKSPSRIPNLLDFDIPPAPTPRSLPTITVRELESLKSNFLSEISSLKASLSGKEAEVLSLKSAVGDAEERVGKCMEQVREERNLRGQLAAEKEGWDRRGREMEQVLRNAKEEILHGGREREELENRLEESEKRREAAEVMAQEAESKMAGILAGSMSTDGGGTGEKKCQPTSISSEAEVAVEKVAKELHSLYKNKHETKVAALKKSYEGRWAKKVTDLEAKLDELSKENEELKVGRDATMSGVVPGMGLISVTEELRLQAAKDAETVKELEARLRGLAEEVKSVKSDNSELRSELEKERIEKGELVAACDELLALQETSPVNHPTVETTAEKLMRSISRGSGLRAPNISGLNSIPPSENRTGKVERNRTGSVLGTRPGSGLGSRGGIMSAIEKMGGHK
jgi:hypothetical protein